MSTQSNDEARDVRLKQLADGLIPLIVQQLGQAVPECKRDVSNLEMMQWKVETSGAEKSELKHALRLIEPQKIISNFTAT